MTKSIFSGIFNNFTWKSSGSFDQSFSAPEKVIIVDHPFHVSLVFLPICQPQGAHQENEHKKTKKKIRQKLF